MEDDSNSEKNDEKIDSSNGVRPENSPDVDRSGTDTSSTRSDALVVSPSPTTSQPGLLGQDNALTQSVLNVVRVEEPNSGELRARLPPLPPGSGRGKRKIDGVYADSCASDYNPSSITRPRPLGSSSLGVVWPPPPMGTSYTPFEQSSILSQLTPGPLGSSSGVSIRQPFGRRLTLSELPGLPRLMPRPLGRSPGVVSIQPPPLIATSDNNPPPFVRPAIPRPHSPSLLGPMPTPSIYDDAVEAAVTLPPDTSTLTQNENVNETPTPPPREDEVKDHDSNTMLESHESSD